MPTLRSKIGNYHFSIVGPIDPQPDRQDVYMAQFDAIENLPCPLRAQFIGGHSETFIATYNAFLGYIGDVVNAEDEHMRERGIDAMGCVARMACGCQSCRDVFVWATSNQAIHNFSEGD